MKLNHRPQSSRAVFMISGVTSKLTVATYNMHQAEINVDGFDFLSRGLHAIDKNG